MKYWEVLLIKQRERGRDGLTIPFIIGSQKFLPNNFARQIIKELIKDIVSSNSFETCIRYCIGTQTLILELRKPKNAIYYPKYNGQKQTNMSVAVFLKVKLGLNIDNLIDKLVEDFQEPINNELFSAVPNVDARNVIWETFSNEDIQFIKDSFKFL